MTIPISIYIENKYSMYIDIEHSIQILNMNGGYFGTTRVIQLYSQKWIPTICQPIKEDFLIKNLDKES